METTETAMYKPRSQAAPCLFHANHLTNVHDRIYGDAKNISGSAAAIYGDVSHISGDVTHVSGDMTHVTGNLTGVRGNFDYMRDGDDISLCTVSKSRG